MRKKWMFLAPVVLVGFLLFIALGGTVVLQLWNWLLPSIFGWRQITFWEALGLLALCRILFGGLGGRGLSSSRVRGRMSPEDRERFRKGLRGRFGCAPSAGSAEQGMPRPAE